MKTSKLQILKKTFDRLGLKEQSNDIHELMKVSRKIMDQNVPNKGSQFNRVIDLISDFLEEVENKQDDLLETDLNKEDELKNILYDFFVKSSKIMIDSLNSIILEDSSFEGKDIFELSGKAKSFSLEKFKNQIKILDIQTISSYITEYIDALHHDLYHLIINKFSYKKFEIYSSNELKYHLFDKLDEDIAACMSDRRSKSSLDNRFAYAMLEIILKCIKGTKLESVAQIRLEEFRRFELNRISSDKYLDQNRYYKIENRISFLKEQFEKAEDYIKIFFLKDDALNTESNSHDTVTMYVVSEIQKDEKEFFISLFDKDENPDELSDKVLRWERTYYDQIFDLIIAFSKQIEGL